MYLDKITSSYANRVYKETGINVKDFSIVLNSCDIRHMFNEHGNENRENQVSVTFSNVDKMIETIINPDSINKSESNNRAIVVSKTFINKYIAIEFIYSGKTLGLKTGYIHKKNRIRQHLMASQTSEPLHITSETTTSSINFKLLIIAKM